MVIYSVVGASVCAYYYCLSSKYLAVDGMCRQYNYLGLYQGEKDSVSVHLLGTFYIIQTLAHILQRWQLLATFLFQVHLAINYQPRPYSTRPV